MARYKTLADSPIIAKAKLDPTETAPALGKGQPLTVTKFPAEGTSEIYLVKTCADGVVPDFVVGNTAISSSPGDMLYAGMPGAPVLLGGAVTRGDLLSVKSGKFVKAAAKDVCVFMASTTGAAGDLIVGFAPGKVA